MTNLFLVPRWFFGYDIAFELAFAIISLLVSIYAFKIYKLTENRQIRLFGIAFMLFSISYFLQSILNYAILQQLSDRLCYVFHMCNVPTLNFIGIYIHFIFFLSGLITLNYITLKIKSKKTFSMILIIITLSVISSANKIYLFYLISSILLIYIVWHYLKNFLKNKKFKNLIVLIAFVFLLFGNIHFIFSVNHSLFYVLGHALELIAYLLILLNLILILRK